MHFEAIVPRLSDKVWIRPSRKQAKTPWTYDISIFRDYHIETKDKLNDCFEFDWQCMKLPRMSENEMDEVKEYLRTSYGLM
jgi:hypothetical protein